MEILIQAAKQDVMQDVIHIFTMTNIHKVT